MINRRTFTLFSMCTAVGVSGLANAQADKKPKILVVYFSKTNHTVKFQMRMEITGI